MTSIAEMFSRRKAGLWAGGKVPSGQSVHVTYAGEPPKPVSKIFGQLRVWRRDGKASEWSAPVWG